MEQAALIPTPALTPKKQVAESSRAGFKLLIVQMGELAHIPSITVPTFGPCKAGTLSSTQEFEVAVYVRAVLPQTAATSPGHPANVLDLQLVP